ncbi:MAG: M55 family metallopeptidase [Phycisphaeraceae bacterium]
MKFAVAVDCEGPACVVGKPGGTLTDSPNFEFAKRQATREADAAARGLFAAGATQVLVYDYHGDGVNLNYDLLDKRVDIAVGSGTAHRLPGLDDSFAGLLLVGYHAMDNTPDAVICHTFNSVAFQWMKVNGQEVGEMAIDAAVAGERGVPVILVSSDDKGVAEAQRFFPGIESVTTKTAYGYNSAISMHPARAVDAIFAAAQCAGHRAAQKGAFKPYMFPSPLTLEVHYKRIEGAESASRRGQGWERVDAYTVRRTMRTISEYF